MVPKNALPVVAAAAAERSGLSVAATAGKLPSHFVTGSWPARSHRIMVSADVSCIERTSFNALLARLGRGVDIDIETHLENGDTVVRVALPLLTGDLLIYRTAVNIRAVDRNTGECVWESFHLDRQLNAAQQEFLIEDKAFILRQGRLQESLTNHWLRANGGGQITCDGRTVFAVEESTQETMRLDLDNQPPAQLKATNYLRAYDLASGMTRGQAGWTDRSIFDERSRKPTGGNVLSWRAAGDGRPHLCDCGK